MTVSEYANRGMAFEEIISKTNETYKERGMAFIQKVPTPIKVIHAKKNGFIHGCFAEKSTVDYYGVCHGRHISFEAKSTKSRTRFDLKNIPPHQMKVLEMVKDQGGISFLLLEFSKHKEVYVITYDQLYEWVLEAEVGGRKSIPYDWILTNCPIVSSEKGIILHYLKWVVQL